MLALIGLLSLRVSGATTALENWILDLELKLGSGAVQKTEIAIVNITDEEYDQFFGGKSPLNVLELNTLIDAIRHHTRVEAARQNVPKLVIGVDIDTSDQSFWDFTNVSDWQDVIWERDVFIRNDGIVPVDVLAGRYPELIGRSGIPQLRDDPVGKSTRFYTRCIETAVGRVPSFVSAVAGASRLKDVECKDIGADWLQYITYTGSYSLDQQDNIIPARAFLQPDTENQLFKLKDKKAVLLGGSYRDFDRHFTPLGVKTGVEILANAIQTELDQSSIPVLSPVLLSLVPPPRAILNWVIEFLLFDLFAGCFILWVLKSSNVSRKVKRISWVVSGVLFALVIVSPLLLAIIPWLGVRWAVAVAFVAEPPLVAVFIVVATEKVRDSFFPS